MLDQRDDTHPNSPDADIQEELGAHLNDDEVGFWEDFSDGPFDPCLCDCGSFHVLGHCPDCGEEW